MVWVTEEEVVGGEYKLFLGLVTLSCGIFKILHLRYPTSTGWLESLCFGSFDF